MKVHWDIEEMVALFEVYNLQKSNNIDDLEQRLSKLSNQLILRADTLGIQHDAKFRNVTGLKMMLQNIRYVDSGNTQGLSQAGSVVYYVYYMYKVDIKYFSEILNNFHKKYGI